MAKEPILIRREEGIGIKTKGMLTNSYGQGFAMVLHSREDILALQKAVNDYVLETEMENAGDHLEKDRKFKKALASLTEREKEALKEALMVIYLDDNSDYLNGLWGVVKAIIGDTWDDEGFQVETILALLNPEMATQD